MNKRIRKKKMKQLWEYIRTKSRKDGVSVLIKSQMFIDEKGRECSPRKEGAKFITLRNPIIKFIKHSPDKSIEN